ncbi:MAG: AAA family ATPase [Planctomyces sp.]|nr:AAA family ATPase [Planctomyces sp.]
MPLTSLRVENYRSLRSVELPLQPLTVITGPNGSGKSNLYRSLWLLAQIAEGGFGRALAREGGLVSALWAGQRSNQKPVRMSLGIRTDDFSFQLCCGFPQPGGARNSFPLDAEIKEEAIWFGPKRKPSTTLLERNGAVTRARDRSGVWTEYQLELSENESVLSQLREPERFPELYTIRDQVRGWRFYHGFRTEPGSPLREPQVSVRTPVLNHDGGDLAAALQTIFDMGAGDLATRAIDRAFPGCALEIVTSKRRDSLGYDVPGAPELSVGLRMPGCLRTLHARELSDGTLRYLCLVAALLSERPCELIALNEPESSLHPELIRPLAGLIVDASRRSQVWVTTHSEALAKSIEEQSGVRTTQLGLVQGETRIESSDNE